MAEALKEVVAEPTAASVESGELDTLLQKEFRPKTDEAKEAVEKAVRTLAEQALAQTQLIGADVVQSITAMIAEIDHKLSEQIKVAAAAHSPFIAGASPTVMQMGTWQELADPRDLTKIFLTPEYASWRSLRDSDDSRYL